MRNFLVYVCRHDKILLVLQRLYATLVFVNKYANMLCHTQSENCRARALDNETWASACMQRWISRQTNLRTWAEQDPLWAWALAYGALVRLLCHKANEYASNGNNVKANEYSISRDNVFRELQRLYVTHARRWLCTNTNKPLLWYVRWKDKVLCELQRLHKTF